MDTNDGSIKRRRLMLAPTMLFSIAVTVLVLMSGQVQALGPEYELRWTIIDEVDQMSDQQIVKVVSQLDLDKASFIVTEISCPNDDVDVSNFPPIPSDQVDLSKIRRASAREIMVKFFYSNPNKDLMRFFSLERRSDSWFVSASVRIDDGPVAIRGLPADHSNVAKFPFFSAREMMAKGILALGLLNEGYAADQVRGFIKSVNDNMLGTTDFTAAKLVRFQLPLANGDKPVIRILPRDPAIQKFLTACGIS